MRKKQAGFIIILFSLMLNVNHLRAEERDPFVSIIDLRDTSGARRIARIELANVVLKGIIWSDAQAAAIINEELLMRGDNFEGFKVERIDKDSITLNDGEKSFRLFLEETSPLDKKARTAESEERLSEEGSDYPQDIISGGEGTTTY